MEEKRRDLWEREGTGKAPWLEEIQCAMASRVLPTPEEGWDLQPPGAAPGPDRLATFQWKCAHSLHERVASAFQAISR